MTRLVSSGLLVAGVVLVFAGLSTALGFTAGGVTASVAAIVTLLYAGAVWFGRATPAPERPAAPGEAVIVFDAALSVVCGSRRGTSVLAQFPEFQQAEITARCAGALSGQSARLTCEYRGSRTAFDVVPVHASDGAIVFGMMIDSAAAAELPAVSLGRGRTAGSASSTLSA